MAGANDYPSTVDLLIVSGSSRVRTAAPINHRIYADHIGVPYLFDLAPSIVSRIYLHKLDVLRRALPLAEWVFWIDDDAFFTDFSIDLRAFLEGAEGVDLVFARSPVNPKGGWTWMSSGQFFIRRSPDTIALLDAVADTDLSVVKAWWDHDRYGLFTNGDQDALVYQLIGPAGEERWRDRWLRLDWPSFNSRPYHYESSLDEHFVCHFAVPGGRPKHEVVAEFAARLGTTPALVDADRLVPYRTFLERSELGPLVGVMPPPPPVRRQATSPTKAKTPRTLAGRAARRAKRLGRRITGR